MKLIVGYRVKAFLALVVLLCAAGMVSAANPHFVGKVTATFEDTNVQVCWKEAGLGDNQLINYTASADGIATYVCVNNGGQCPNAANKVTVAGPVTAIGLFSSGKNGQITACLTISPPGPGSFMCPPGQDLTLSEVGFSNIWISDNTNDVSAAATPRSFSATLFTCP